LVGLKILQEELCDRFSLRLQRPKFDEPLKRCPYDDLKELVTDDPLGTIELCIHSRVVVRVDCNE